MMKRNRLSLVLTSIAVLVVVLSLAAVGCGGDTTTTTAATTGTTAGTTDTTGATTDTTEMTFEPMKLRVAGVFPPPNVSMMSEIVETWGTEITERTNGAITFEYLWGAALGAPAEHIDLLQSGAVDIVQTHEWYTPDRFPLGHFEYIFPFGPTDPELTLNAHEQIRSEYPQFAEDEAKNNAVMLVNAPGGEYNFMSKDRLATVEDFKGKNVSLVGRYFGQWMPPGATAVVRPAGERYDMLRTGVSDVDLLPFDLFYAFKIHEVTKYYIKADLMTALWGPVLMNMDKFNAMPPELQDLFVEVGNEVEQRVATEIIPKWYDKAVADWEAAGIEIVEFPDAEKAKWAATLKDIPAEWATEVEALGYPGFEIVKRWQEITTEMGFDWAREWGAQ